MNLLEGDLMLARGMGLSSALIRVGTREPGEAPSIVNHSGVIVVGGPVNRARLAESLPQGTVDRPLRDYRRAGADSVVIYRLQTLTDAQRAAVAAAARSYVGKRYGWLQVLADAGDWLLGSRWFFRGMLPADRNPVCSAVVALSYAVVGYRFRALPPTDITPDDIWDDVTCSVPPWMPVGVV
jgi:hypothetical protein